MDEDWKEGQAVEDPERFTSELKRSAQTVDIFTFAQKIPDCKPHFNYKFVWDDAAAIPITTFQEWWAYLSSDRRKDIKRSEKQGIVVNTVEFNDDLVRGIVKINNDTPFRQGKRFKHYGKDFETVKREYATFPDRSEFIAAFYEGDLAAILKMVYVGELACFLEVLSKTNYSEKRPINAIIAKAVEVAAVKHKSYITYGRYYYGNKRKSSFTDFKKRNGFQRIVYPRYYIPLTLKGRIAMGLRLHLGLLALLPAPLISLLLSVRSLINDRILEKKSTTSAEDV